MLPSLTRLHPDNLLHLGTLTYDTEEVRNRNTKIRNKKRQKRLKLSREKKKKKSKNVAGDGTQSKTLSSDLKLTVLNGVRPLYTLVVTHI